MFTSTTASNIVFTGLTRGVAYQLKCIAETTHSENASKVTSTATLQNALVIGSTNTNTATFVPTASVSTQCVQWQFLADPGTNTKNLLVNYCQRLFARTGYSRNGCIVCSFSDVSYTPA